MIQNIIVFFIILLAILYVIYSNLKCPDRGCDSCGDNNCDVKKKFYNKNED